MRVLKILLQKLPFYHFHIISPSISKIWKFGNLGSLIDLMNTDYLEFQLFSFNPQTPFLIKYLNQIPKLVLQSSFSAHLWTGTFEIHLYTVEASREKEETSPLQQWSNNPCVRPSLVWVWSLELHLTVTYKRPWIVLGLLKNNT